MKQEYSIGSLARIAGVSVRTLHHYDSIGLLMPGKRSETGYRVYGEDELLRLQSILLYRELEVPLTRIKRLLDEAEGGLEAGLRDHRASVEMKMRRLGVLLSTIDKTIARMGGEHTMMTDEELYEGFAKEDVSRIKKETQERWGSTRAYKESQKRVAKMTKEQWAKVKEEGVAVDRACAEAFKSGIAADSPEARRIMARKAEQLRHFYEPHAALFKGLGEMYVSDERFKSHYEELAHGLAEWLRDAMADFAAKDMRN